MYLKKPYFADWPLGDKFGLRFHPIEKKEKMHNGQDIKMPASTKLYAPLSGTAYCDEDDRSGKYMVINSVTEQGVKVQFVFCHLSEFLVKNGQHVSEWQDIALSGNTGASTGAHLHFGVMIFNYKTGEYDFVDPIKYFDFRSEK